MSTPRRTVGTSAEGRLPAAMLRALAAELSDPGRFARAKGYARDGMVTDIDVAPSAARGLVQGSRYEPYAVTIHCRPAREGEGLLGLIPERDELFLECTCPDAETFGACKHGLAVLLVLADEISIDPGVLERWRASDDAAESPFVRGRAVPDRSADDAPHVDVLADATAAPAPLPEVPTVPSRVPVTMPVGAGRYDHDVSAALASAIAVLRAR